MRPLAIGHGLVSAAVLLFACGSDGSESVDLTHKQASGLASEARTALERSATEDVDHAATCAVENVGAFGSKDEATLVLMSFCAAGEGGTAGPVAFTLAKHGSTWTLGKQSLGGGVQEEYEKFPEEARRILERDSYRAKATARLQKQVESEVHGKSIDAT